MVETSNVVVYRIARSTFMSRTNHSPDGSIMLAIPPIHQKSPSRNCSGALGHELDGRRWYTHATLDEHTHTYWRFMRFLDMVVTSHTCHKLPVQLIHFVSSRGGINGSPG